MTIFEPQITTRHPGNDIHEKSNMINTPGSPSADRTVVHAIIDVASANKI